MDTGFQQLELRAELLEALTLKGIHSPSQIQLEAIPLILQGKDIIAQSQTGSGKTLAYLLPILNRLDAASKETQAVVIAPTRELCVQIVSEMERYGASLNIRSQALIGGATIGRQIEKLRLHPHIVVGTPGRMVELIKARKLKMHEVRTIVADEADQLVSMSTIEDVKHILKSALRDRQIAFFSATVTPDVQYIADRWMNDPVVIAVKPEHRTAESIEHLFVECEEREKVEFLRRLYRTLQPKSALVFVNEIEPIAEIVSKLEFAHIPVAALYGDAPKQERTKVLGQFREGKIRLLIATDVAARGLDISDITHVFHLDPATNADYYVHRVGRTGRMGKSGVTLSIITNREAFILRKFEEELGIQIQRRVLSEGKLLKPEQLRMNSRPFSATRHESTAGRSESARTTNQQGRESNDSNEPTRVNRHSVKASLHTPQTQKSQTGAKSNVSSIKDPAAEQKAAFNQARSKERARERDKKNKGAPKWLKAKKEQGPGPNTPT